MADSDTVTVKDPDTGRTRTVDRDALKFFVNQGYEVLDSRGRVSGSATTAATKKESN